MIWKEVFPCQVNTQMIRSPIFSFTRLAEYPASGADCLSCETGRFTEDSLNEIFRLVHTIKGSASMMLYSNISNVSHKLEDLFFFLRERPDIKYDNEELSEIVLCVIDFIKRSSKR